MKKNVLALSIATAIVGFAGSAHAVLPAAGAVDATGATTDLLRVGNAGTGHALIIPYYSTQKDNSTLLSIVNTDSSVGKAVKVRFRGAANSDDVYDFQVFLSPGDVWTANVSANADGLSYLTTTDNSCTKPSKAVLNSTPFVTSRVNPNSDKNLNTREGYVEIFNMADITPGATGLFPLIKHKDGVAPCGDVGANTAWSALNIDKSVAQLAAIGVVNPTTGLFANWTVINVKKAISWSGEATAVEAVNTENRLGAGVVNYFPQIVGNVSPADALLFTADPLLQGAVPVVKPALYDLPDLSTPYTRTIANASQQAQDLADAISTLAVMNEYWSDPFITAQTDWVFSSPTRRYAAAVNYAATPKPAPVYNTANAKHFSAANTQMDGDKLCVSGITVSPWDREERNPISPDDVVISPSTPGAPTLFCGEASVLSINNAGSLETSALGASLAVKDIDVGFKDGWLKLNTPGATGAGLPVLGQSFISAYNPGVTSGTAGNFNIGFEHRYIRPVAAPGPVAPGG